MYILMTKYRAAFRLQGFWMFLGFLFYSYGAAIAQEPFPCTGDFYLSLSNNQGNSTFYQLIFDPLTNNANFNQISVGNSGATVNAIGYRSTDNLIYGVNPTTQALFQIDASGIATFLTDIQGVNSSNRIISGDMTPDGKSLVVIGARPGVVGGADWDTELVLINMESGNYETTIVPLVSASSGGQNPPNTLCADIAFDPITSILYGYDAINRRLITINMETGLYADNGFPNFPSNPDILGAIFFDAFGRLYGYGRPLNGDDQNTFFTIDKVSGAVTASVTGPRASGNDGCSCPYTVRMNKVVNETQALPCAEVIYTFEIVNNSGTVQNGVNFTDQMPSDFLITEIMDNPFGGTINQGIGTNHLEIMGMTLPVGTFELLVKVEIGEMALGHYNNQALLSNLPVSLGEIALSDDPRTAAIEDSTHLEVIPLNIDFSETIDQICEGDSLLLDATFSGVNYLWNDGSTASTLLVLDAGTYSVTATSNCDQSIETIDISTTQLGLNLGRDLEIELGEELVLHPQVWGSEDLIYEWSSENVQNPMVCLDCETQSIIPFYDDVYNLLISTAGGCFVADELQVTINKNRDVYIPNAFSPNFDGRNDYFFPFSARQEKVKLMRVYNRWGALIYEMENVQTNDFSVGWNGSFRGQAVNPDVYLYWIEVEFLDGFVETFYGDITVLK